MIDRRDGITLYVAQVGRWWRRWWWGIYELGAPDVEGRAWTREGAIDHGRIARAMRLATRRLP